VKRKWGRNFTDEEWARENAEWHKQQREEASGCAGYAFLLFVGVFGMSALGHELSNGVWILPLIMLIVALLCTTGEP
jgi:hypothetical protein